MDRHKNAPLDHDSMSQAAETKRSERTNFWRVELVQIHLCVEVKKRDDG